MPQSILALLNFVVGTYALPAALLVWVVYGLFVL